MDKFLKRKLDSDNSDYSENKSSSKSTSVEKKAKFRLLYCDDYLKFGFNTVSVRIPPAPQYTNP